MSNTATIVNLTKTVATDEVAVDDADLATSVLVPMPLTSRPAKTAVVGRACGCGCGTSIVDTNRKDAKFVSGHDARLVGQVGRLIIGQELTHPVPTWATGKLSDMLDTFEHKFSTKLSHKLDQWVARENDKKFAKIAKAEAAAEKAAAKVGELATAAA